VRIIILLHRETKFSRKKKKRVFHWYFLFVCFVCLFVFVLFSVLACLYLVRDMKKKVTTVTEILEKRNRNKSIRISYLFNDTQTTIAYVAYVN